MKLHLHKAFLAVVIATLVYADTTYAENHILTNQIVEGNGAVNEYVELINKDSIEWVGTKEESVNYSQNTINYTTSNSTSRSEGIISITSEGFSQEPQLTINGYGNVDFNSNTVSASNTQGSAIHLEGTNNKNYKNAQLNITDNTQVSFSGNTATATTDRSYGGAISMMTNSSANITGNGSVTFSNNTANAKTYVYGGAIYTTATIDTGAGKVTDLSISENTNVSFINNTAKTSAYHAAKGGAIYAAKDTEININDNTGKVEFIGNGVEMSGSAKGGAIYVDGGYKSSDPTAKLSIRGNQEVVFAGNYEHNSKNDTYRLRSLYGMNAAKGISISAKKGGSIEFRDSIYINGNISLNEDYNGEKQTGKVIFSGRTTVEDLRAAIAANTAEGETARNATETEIIESRTNIIEGNLIMSNGTLSLQDNTILQATTVTITGDASLEVLLTNGSGAPTFGLEEAAIAATINANLVLEDNSSITLAGGLLDMNNKNITLGDSVSITATGIYAQADEEGMITLLKNVNKLTIGGDAVDSGIVMLNINGVEQEAVYDKTNGVVKVAYKSVPEPATATLSLLALAALAARRRRK